MYDESAAHAIAEHVLKRSPADQTEVVLWAERSQLTRFANNTIHQHVAEEDAQITVRAVFGQRVGVASGNQLDSASLDEVVDRAATIAAYSPKIPLSRACRRRRFGSGPTPTASLRPPARRSGEQRQSQPLPMLPRRLGYKPLVRSARRR